MISLGDEQTALKVVIITDELHLLKTPFESWVNQSKKKLFWAIH